VQYGRAAVVRGLAPQARTWLDLGSGNGGLVRHVASQSREAEYQSALKQTESGGGSLARALDLVEWLLGPKSDGISGRLLSAPWDPWPELSAHQGELADSEIYTLRRIVPGDRGKDW
jgi:hypothetical protein